MFGSSITLFITSLALLSTSLAASPNTTHDLSKRAASDKFLAAHNEIRAQHGADDLTWSDSLAEMATTWATGCNFANTDGSLTSDFQYGELLIAGTGLKIADAVSAWAADQPAYNPSEPYPNHFTQIVWKSTTELGCDVATCNDIFPDANAKFIVCLYAPAGNIESEIGDNVQV